MRIAFLSLQYLIVLLNSRYFSFTLERSFIVRSVFLDAIFIVKILITRATRYGIQRRPIESCDERKVKTRKAMQAEQSEVANRMNGKK